MKSAILLRRQISCQLTSCCLKDSYTGLKKDKKMKIIIPIRLKYILYILGFLLIFINPIIAQENSSFKKIADEKHRIDNAILIIEGNIELLEYELEDYQIGILSLAELRILRNSIFAKYGYTFKSHDLKEHFYRFTWYKPNDNFSENIFSEIDENNIQKVLDFENQYRSKKIITIEKNDLIGYWHELLVVPSGYAKRYAFHEDGKFEWFNNQMDGSTRMHSIVGTWTIENNFVKVFLSNYTWLFGDEFELPYASYASDFVIESNDYRDLRVDDDNSIFFIPFNNYQIDAEASSFMGNDVYTMIIAGSIYYKGPYN